MKKNCKDCKNQNTELCDECSVKDDERQCSCHVNPPCSYCVESNFEDKDN